MEKEIIDIYNSLQEIAWHFGSHGINGECCADLSFVEFIALKRVYENADISIQEIGNTLSFTKSGATRIINRLENKGYVIRENSPIDGRVCCVLITNRGIEVISKTTENYTVYLEDVLKEFELQRVEHIRDVLEMLVIAIQCNKSFNINTDTCKEEKC